MGSYVLTLSQERCPDGVEFAPHPWVRGNRVIWPSERRFIPSEEGDLVPDDGIGSPMIRYRSQRRETFRRRLETPDQLIVTEFLNATPPEDDGEGEDYSRLLEFVSEYGFPLRTHSSARLKEYMLQQKRQGVRVMGVDDVKAVTTDSDTGEQFVHVEIPGFEPLGEGPLRLVLIAQEGFQEIWDTYRTGTAAEVVESFRGWTPRVIPSIEPDFDLRDGKPTLSLPTTSLYAFMLLETALVITGGSRVTRCAQCAAILVTGSGTGRRGTSLYCSNRCRVAAQRSRSVTPS
jgi:hypothetical protein